MPSSQTQQFVQQPGMAMSPAASYRPQAGVYDEMLDPSGTVRPHWAAFHRWLEGSSPSDLATRTSSLRQLLRDHGVTYNIYDDALGTSRPWELDLIPLIIDEDEWMAVARGLQQRGRLLEALVADIYGAQRCLKEGRLPPALVFANPSFQRAAMGVQPVGSFIFGLAHDLVRGPNGHWLVLADRAQVPFGQGYTLENRVIMANVHPEEFEASHVHRLGAYFGTERRALQSLAPHRKGDAGILMLAPNPRSESYFEVAFKARHLGFPLVEGADITVRDRRLQLKTLEGLIPADVVIRQVTDSECDPLELDPNGCGGTAGFVEAWRSGSVALANGIGTGVIETPALQPFLPGLCRLLLGEELKMPCVPTWWCGQPRELAMVLSDPDRWVLKSTFHRGAHAPVHLASLPPDRKQQFLNEVRAQPNEWIAQEMLPLSTCPAWTGERLEARPLVWRSYGFASLEGRLIMPGGLSRVSPETDNWIVSMRSGGLSKDTWIVSKSPVADTPLQPRLAAAVRPTRPPGSVPSRAADHLFWLGRYAERLEQTVRVLRIVLGRLSGERINATRGTAETWATLLDHLSLAQPGSPSLQARILGLLADSGVEGNIPDLVGRLVYNAAAARDRLSDDSWRLINRIQRDARFSSGRLVLTTSMEKLDTLILDLAAFCGMQLENTTRGHGWRFLEVGRRIERTAILSKLIGGATASVEKMPGILDPLLDVCDSAMTYRRLHFAQPSLEPMLDLLMLNADNPRSIAFQLQALSIQTAQLPTASSTTSEVEQQIVADMEADLHSLCLGPDRPTRDDPMRTVPALCNALAKSAELLSNRITEHYFSHATRRVR